MRFFERFRRNKTELTKITRELEGDVSRIKRQLFPSEYANYVTFYSYGEKPEKNRLELIEEKLDLLARNAGLVFEEIDDNFALVEPKEETK